MGDRCLFSMDNDVFKNFVFYAALVLLKTTVMTLLTARHRLGKKVFNNLEDYSRQRSTPATLTTDPDVERVRRCHQNDIENVFPFVLIGLLFVSTGPQLSTALWHFRIFACSRLLHTVIYLNAVPQPARAMIFVPGILVNVSMAVTAMWASWL